MVLAFLKENLWMLILAAIALVLVFPILGKPFEGFVVYLLMLLMFFSCLNISLKKVYRDFHDWKILAAWGIIHVVGPLLVLLLKPFFSDEIFLGLIIVAGVSSGLSVVVLSEIFGGHPSKSLVITTLSNVASPVVVPLVVLVFARTSISVDPLAMGVSMVKLIIVPLVLASLVRKTRWIDQFRKKGSNVSIILLLFVIMGVVSPVRDILVGDWRQALLLSAVGVVLIGVDFWLGFLLGKGRAERISFSISTSYKNYTLAMVIGLSLFTPLVALPAVVYAIVNSVLLAPIQFFYQRRAR